MMAASAATAVRLLLVEDDPDSRDAAARALRKQGFQVDAAESAGAALVRLEVAPKPAAAVIDLRLPDGNGDIILWRIRREYGRTVPVAVVTAVADPLSRPALVREQPDVIFPKPLNIKGLVAWLKSVT